MGLTLLRILMPSVRDFSQNIDGNIFIQFKEKEDFIWSRKNRLMQYVHLTECHYNMEIIPGV